MKINKNFKRTLLWIAWVFIVVQLFFTIVDIYNFSQLKKAIPILEELPEETEKFYTVNKFNDLTNFNLKPIYKCYYISNNTKDDTYIFGFKLNSLLFQFYQGTDEYAYPYYNKEYWHFCDGKCYDKARDIFKKTISHSCDNFQNRFWSK